MKSLLKANFHKLFRSKVFWIVFIAMPCINIYAALSDVEWLTPHKFEMKSGYVEWVGWSLSEVFTYLGHLLYFTYAVIAVIALFVGEELSAGTIRNKILAGHSRTKLFLSYFITTYLGMVLIHIVSELVGIGFCLLRFGTGFYDKYDEYKTIKAWQTVDERLHEELHYMLQMNLAAVIAIAGLTAITLLLMMAIGKRAPGFIAVIVYDIISQTYVTDKLYSINTMFEWSEESLTPSFKSTLYTLCCDPNGMINTTGEQFFMTDITKPLLWVCMCFCLLTAAVLLTAGVIVMNKRDLK
ncbi:MAG: ABC transporter permease [Ruminococcus sp.]|nr:ABC transporter permease [Ruminococcus sp.]